MQKLFRIRLVNLFFTLKTNFKNPKSLLPISHLHSSSKALNSNSKLDFLYNQVESISRSKSTKQTTQLSLRTNEQSCESEPTRGNESTVQISHPWLEWVDLMELLLKSGYFEGSGYPFGSGEFGGKETNSIRTACLNFARDRSGLMRLLSRKDIQLIVGYGCPSLDRKVVNSGKRLRSHFGINEGNVCSSCNLRGDCDRAYVKAREDKGGRTVDVMRILLTYGIDSLSGISVDKLCQNKMVEESVRRLLKDIVKYSRQLDTDLPNGTLSNTVSSTVRNHPSLQHKDHIKSPMKQGDWICRKCYFLNFARNIKCLRCNDWSEEKLKQLKEEKDHLPLKKGDWICERCSYLNFAKNTRCLQCEQKPSKRHLNPGEWECESCNYINFRKNMVCLKCDHKRPKASKALNITTEPQNEGGSHKKHSGSRFAFSDIERNAHNSRELRRTSQSIGASTWRFVDEEREDNDLFLTNEDSEFVDFPIKGGKSSLSQNSQKREKWIQHMVERSKGTARTIERDEKWRYAKFQRRFDYAESPDDDMTGWFGQRKDLETKFSFSVCEKKMV